MTFIEELRKAAILLRNECNKHEVVKRMYLHGVIVVRALLVKVFAGKI